MPALPILALLLLPAALGASLCPSVDCSYPTLSWTGGVCGQPSQGGNAYTFNPTICSNSTEYCQFTNLNSDSVCIPQKVVPAYDAFPGEKCTEDHLCVSGDCVEGKCKPFQTCQMYYDCDSMKYCSNGQCLPLVPEGGTCYHEYECMQNAGCDTVAQGVKGTCRNYLSLEPGRVVLSCNTTGITGFGVNYLCQSSNCYNFYGAYKCTEITSSQGGKPPLQCTMGSSCASQEDKVSSMISTTPCQCGYNAKGQGYCPLFVGDKETENVFKEWSRWLDSDEIMTCNTYSRPNTNQYLWCLQSTDYKHYWDLIYHAERVNFYSQIIDAEKCYLKFVARDYYVANDKYDAASFLMLGVVAFLGLA